jgi:hypothetical protein
MMTNNNLTDELMQEIYEEAVSAECFERANVDAACFDLLCKTDEAGGLSRTVRVLIDMVRAGRAELEQYRMSASGETNPDYQSFEQWWERENGQPLESWEYQRCDGGYFDEAMDGQFATWNACRAAMLNGGKS